MSCPGVSCFGVAIDTDAYAGNFERQMCAHITGHVGDCGAGDEFVTEEAKSLFGDDRIARIADDHGCRRPCTIWHTPAAANKYQTVLIYFWERPTVEEIAIIKERAGTFIAAWNRVYSERGYMSLEMTDIIGFRLIEFRMIETESVI